MKKTVLFALICGVAVSASNLFASADLAPATGGSAISADTTGGSYTTLSGPSLAEQAPGDISTGDIVLNAPSGFVFDASSTVTVSVTSAGTGNDIVLHSATAVVTTTTITIAIDSISDGTRVSTLDWSGIKVRPTAGTPLASGNITESGTAIFSLVAVPPEGYGALAETHGAPATLTLTQQPTSERVGHIFNTQPAFKITDAFGTVLTDLPSSDVSIALTSGTGRLFGTTNIDVGSAAGAGFATFTSLEINDYGNKQLTASYSGLSSVTTSTFTNAGTAQRLTLAGNYATGNSPRGIALANFRGQGTWRDMVVGNSGDGTASVRLCNDDGTYGGTSTYAAGLGAMAPTFLDTDLDGKEEFVVANSGTNTVTVWKNTSKGVFGSSHSYAVSSNPNAGPVHVAVADLNHDGRFDLVTANYNDATISVMLGSAGGVFTNVTTYNVGNNPSGVYISDINNDGKSDIIVANTTDGSISVLLGIGDGTFVYTPDFVLFPAGNPQPVRVIVADMNKDHVPDLITVNRGSNTVSIFTNDTLGGFSLSASYETGTRPTDVLYRDVDMDGINDLVVANSGSGTFTLMIHNDDGTFNAAETVTAGANSSAVAGSNLNGDGLGDLAIVNTDDNTVGVYLYTAPAPVSTTITVPESRTTTISLISKCLLPGIFSYPNVTTPLHGTLTPTAIANKFDYTPTPGYIGSDIVFYQVSNGSITSSVGSVSITVKLVNVAPSFNLPVNSVTVAEDAGTQTFLNFATNLDRGQASESSQVLAFTVTNSNHALFATQPTISGAGTLTFKPATNATGIATVSASIYDNGGTNSGGMNRSAVQTFTITVTPVNDPPKIATIAAKSVLEDHTLTFNLPITDIDTPVASLLVTATSANPGLVPNANISASYVGTNWTLSLTPVTDSNGTAVITVFANDQAGGLTSSHFTLTVTAVNDGPSFTLAGSSLSVIGDSGGQTNVHFATNISVGPINEAAQTRSFTVTGGSAALFSSLPAINSQGNLTFTPKVGVVGTNTLSVYMRDSGNSLNGGTNQSSTQNFTIAVTTNNFYHIGGTYTALFYDTPVVEASAGLLSFTVNTARTFSGTLSVDGGKYTLTGKKFDPTGATSFVITRTAKPSLTVNLQLDLTGGSDQVTGTVANGTWTVPLLGDRAVTNGIVPTPGAYTIAFTGFGDGLTSPAGDGIGDVSVATNGAVTLSGGILADTTAMTGSSFLSKNHQWPFYASLYSGGGSVIGWITFTNDVTTDMNGTLTWIKPASSSAYYPHGFTNTLSVIGSSFAIVPGMPALTASSGSIFLTGPTLPTRTNSYAIDANSVLTITTNHDHVTLNLAKPTGILTGLFNTTQTGNYTQIKGILLQKENRARGFFYTTHQSGDFLMQ